jgi:hypothetical protein
MTQQSNVTIEMSVEDWGVIAGHLMQISRVKRRKPHVRERAERLGLAITAVLRPIWADEKSAPSGGEGGGTYFVLPPPSPSVVESAGRELPWNEDSRLEWDEKDEQPPLRRDLESGPIGWRHTHHPPLVEPPAHGWLLRMWPLDNQDRL